MPTNVAKRMVPTLELEEVGVQDILISVTFWRKSNDVWDRRLVI
jgi:hypothetical protein